MPIPNYKTPLHVTVLRGPLVDRVAQEFGNGFGQVYTVRRGAVGGSPFFDVHHFVGPIGAGQEVISRIQTPMNTEGHIYTDSNGVELRQRTVRTDTLEFEASNYYATQMVCYIKDARHQLTMLSSQSHGVASLLEGQMEYMLHRRTLVDDRRGLDRPLNDTTAIVVGLRFVVSDPTTSVRARRMANYDLQYELNGTVFYDPQYSARGTFTGLVGSMPPNVHLVSLKVRDGESNKIILRLHHLYGVGEDASYSLPVTIDIGRMFHGKYRVTSVEEMTLGMNQNMDEMRSYRWKWIPETSLDGEAVSAVSPSGKVGGTVTTISPMDIKAFYVTLAAA